MKMTMITLLVLLAMAIFAMSGCAGYRGYVLIREKTTDEVTVKKNGIIKKTAICGKGIDVWSNKPIAIKMTKDKDGNITYEYSSQKTSFWEKVWGSWKLLKPNSVDIGGK